MRRNNSSYENINIFDRQKPFRTNINPDLLYSLWMRDEPQSSIEIIELNSSSEMPKTPTETTEQTSNEISHNELASKIESCSYVNDMQQTEDSYRINKKARERRRLQNKIDDTIPDISSINENNRASYYKNYINNNINEEIQFANQLNRFQFLNKNLFDSESSSECDIEILTPGDLLMNSNSWHKPQNNYFNEETIQYDTSIDHDTRTVWIYSYKNKHLLSEIELDAYNYNPEKSSSSSSYTTNSSSDKTKESSTEPCRVGSPIPSNFIPRMDLSLLPTLSTVTEISEDKDTPKETNDQKNPKIKKSTNNWCISESSKIEGVRSAHTQEKATNIINWMGLSPREKRRVLKDKSCSDTWVESRLCLVENYPTNGNHGDQTKIKDMSLNDLEQVPVEVEVHVYDDKKDNTTVKEINTAYNFVNNSLNKGSKAANIDVNSGDFKKDRGDHNVEVVIVPALQAKPKRPTSNKSTEKAKPITLDTSICETHRETETKVYDYEHDRSEPILDCNFNDSIDHVWMKNTIPFLKPSHWSEFVPIADSPVSYHLSLGSIVEERKTWYKRFIHFLNCCK